MSTTSLSRNSRKKTNYDELLLHLFLIGTGLLVTLPIFLALFSSFKLPNDITNYPPTLLPEVWTFDNYITAWTSKPFGRFFMNSIIQTGVIVVFQVLFSILAAYAFSVLEFPGRDLLFYLILASLMVPFQLTFIPNFLVISKWGEINESFGPNTYFALTVPFLASAFGVFLLRQFFLTIPKDLHDSAKIDGAGNWRFLWQILVPLSKGSISAFGIFSFLSAWI